MPEFLLQPHALEPLPLRLLREAALSSPYVGASPLAGSFDVSRGFALTFRVDGLPELRRRFSFLGPFLDLALDPDALRRLRPWPLSLFEPGRRALPNAFYLNLLLVGPGAGVGPHLDGTLREDSGEAKATPLLVSVLYLQVPTEEHGSSGGELHLYRNERPIGAIRPQPGTLLHFRGDLKHEVLPFESAEPGATRASLVCEQYRFAPAALARISALAVHSKGGFKAYLAERQGRRESGVGGQEPVPRE
jgi:2-oxoglutarate-Fe(II)-dependent oxygenase superfamily protein